MKKNGKFFVLPTRDGSNFKELFKRLAAAGAGRPTDKDGFPEGPWTPDLLADAISRIDANQSGIELRTVQLWFQDNDKGISIDNIRWLARIFGCGDAEAISDWQVELSAAQSRLTAKRRKGRRLEERLSTEPSDEMRTKTFDGDRNLMEARNAAPRRPKRRINLANRSETFFHGTGSLNLPIAIWACGGLLWLLIYIVGVHKITYSPIEGLNKQVGFLWAPSWTVDRMVFIPLFVISVTGLLNFWKKERRSSLALGNTEMCDDDGWTRKMESFSFSFWVILFVCLAIVFFVQWSGVYLHPLLQGTIGNAMVDWILVAIVRSDVVTINEAIVLSGLANLYSAFVYWCYFSGLLLLYAVINDYYEIYSEPKLYLSDEHQYNAVEVGTKIVIGVFRCTIFGIFSATCIKLNAVYLISDTENIVIWLVNDALTALGLRNEEWGWLTQSPSAFMTSFFVLFITCFIFFICLAQTNRVLEQFLTSKAAFRSVGDQRFESLVSQAKVSWLKMIGVVVLLAANFLLIGQFTGFSILLAGSVLVATYSLFGRA